LHPSAPGNSDLGVIEEEALNLGLRGEATLETRQKVSENNIKTLIKTRKVKITGRGGHSGDFARGSPTFKWADFPSIWNIRF